MPYILMGRNSIKPKLSANYLLMPVPLVDTNIIYEAVITFFQSV